MGRPRSLSHLWVLDLFGAAEGGASACLRAWQCRSDAPRLCMGARHSEMDRSSCIGSSCTCVSCSVAGPYVLATLSLQETIAALATKDKELQDQAEQRCTGELQCGDESRQAEQKAKLSERMVQARQSKEGHAGATETESERG